MKTISVLVTTSALLLVASCSNESQPSFADDLAAITGFNERYLASINNEDIAALSGLTTDGHIMLPPNQEPVVGKAANDAMNGGAFERYEFSETWQPVETVIDGETGILFEPQTTAALAAAMAKSLTISWETPRLRAQAERFSRARFQGEFASLIERWRPSASQRAWMASCMRSM